MTEKTPSPSSDASSEDKAEDLSDIDTSRPPGNRDTEELSVEQIQELLKKSSTTE